MRRSHVALPNPCFRTPSMRALPRGRSRLEQGDPQTGVHLGRPGLIECSIIIVIITSALVQRLVRQGHNFSNYPPLAPGRSPRKANSEKWCLAMILNSEV